MVAHAADKVLLIALDAADAELVEGWIADGSLPNLAGLRGRGAYGRLETASAGLSGATWPTFYTGALPPRHGRYHFLQWDSERMSYRRPTAGSIPLTPFWREIAAPERRVLVIDPPSTYTPEPIDGIEIVGFAAHDHLHAPASYPAGVLRDVVRRFGRPRLGPEVYSSSGAVGLRDTLLASTEQLAGMAENLIENETWSLCLVCFTATHRAGHRLWSARESGRGDAPSEAVKQVYAACDEAVGRLLAAAGSGVTCLVFALHGMRSNTSRVDVLESMLDRVLGDAGAKPRPLGASRNLRRLFPEAARSYWKSRLPLPLQDRLSSRRRTSRIDWRRRRAFSLISDLHGYVRLNIRGRERDGIVEAGAEADELAHEVAESLATFVDADSGQRVVDRVVRVAELFGEGPRASLLPDLIVRWSASAAVHRAIESPQYGRVEWPTPGAHPTGRSGNHRDGGFLIAAGKRFEPAGIVTGMSTLDLKSTVYSLLGIDDDSSS